MDGFNVLQLAFQPLASHKTRPQSQRLHAILLLVLLEEEEEEEEERSLSIDLKRHARGEERGGALLLAGDDSHIVT